MDRKLKQVLSQDQAKLLKYWTGKCSEGRLPVRKEISPADLIFCLSSISILEQKEGEEFTFRLTGSSLKDILGQECRGRCVSDECGNEVPWAIALRRCQATNSPVFGVTPVGHRRSHHWMRMPLQPDENGHQCILCFDRIQFDENCDGPRREMMFVTADMARNAAPVHQNVY